MTTFQMMWKASVMRERLQFQTYHYHFIMQTKYLENAEKV